MNHQQRGLSLALGLLTSAISIATHAQELALEEVIVTAQKRAQSSQDVPIALSAFTGDMIKQIGATDFKGLTHVTPGFSVTGGSDAFARSYIRGIGSNDTGIGADPSVGVYVDGIYASRNGGALTDLMDIARVEVLKGPQGTLFGRNSIGGAISIVTEKPSDEVSGKLALDIGNYNNRQAKALINLPLIEDSLYLRASGSLQKRDGWQDNRVDGNEGQSRDRANGRIKLTWLPTDTLEVNLSSFWSRIDETSAYSDNLIAPGALPVHPVATDIDDTKNSNGNLDLSGLGNHRSPIIPELERNLREHSLSVEWDLNDDLTLTSLSSYRTYTTFTANDYDGTQYFVMNNEGSTEFNESINQELRLNGSTDSLDWFIGANASFERNTMDFTIGIADLIGINGGQAITEASHVSGQTESYAIYGDANWHLTDRLNLTFGARYSRDDKTIHYDNPVQSNGVAALMGAGYIMAIPAQFVDALGNPNPDLAKQQDDWANFSPRLVVDYAINDDAMLYASITRGYKSGGFNTYPTPDSNNAFVVTPTATESFDPELATNYEIGLKSNWMDGRLLFNASVFALDYEDLQVRQIVNNVVQIRNAGKASSNGIELEIKYQLDENLTVSANAAWMDAEYDEYTVAGRDLSGTPLLFSPDFAGNIALDHSLQLNNLGELRSYIS
ncbi:MAG: TonB-dependent receptor, partial [Pseudomonadota bacterium]|nr:TonB-dependent receptor [Pseudomonadota bacterium]